MSFAPPSSRQNSLLLNLHSPPPVLLLFCFLRFILLSTLFTTSTAAAAGGSGNQEALTLHSWLRTSSVSSALTPFSNWNSFDTNPCNWTFITCTQQGFVSEINIQSLPLQLPLPTNLSTFKSLEKLIISDANLTGTLPADLGDCLSLAVIDISSNSLVGPIPPTIGNLQNLQDLILNSNQLTGKIPLEITNCQSLKNLLLFDNQLSGNIPAELGRLSSLEVLRAGGNKDIAGIIPDELGNCSNLTVLGLADTRVSGSIPASLGKLSKLQTLSIYTAMLSGEIPPELGNCSELVNLYLYENGLSGSIPFELGKLRKLEKLLLWQNNLVGVIPKEIGNCRKLKRIDFSLNSLSGTIPWSFGGLVELEEFMISDNNISGSIPSILSNATSLVQLQLDTNQISGLIPPELGMLLNLVVFFAWQNQLEGSIPSSLASCSNLQALDLSHNSLTGVIPPGLFQLRNLTKLLLISNDISGSIPQEIGNCSSLVRLRLGNNRIDGGIPKEIGGLRSLNFLDLSANRLSGTVPDDIGSCTELQMVDLSNNTLDGPLPNSWSSLSGIQVLDVSSNRIVGPIPASFGRLASLNKLLLSKNMFSGQIPPSLGLCLGLQLLDLSSNELSGNIPVELCKIEALEIALNLSYNGLTGPIPAQISALSKLSILDLSHNMLDGDLSSLAGLDNLVSLNISYNNFTGYLPDTKLFRQLPTTDLAANQGLCSFGRDSCFLSNVAGKRMGGTEDHVSRSRRLKLAIALLITLTIAMVIMGTVAVIRARRTIRDDDDSEIGESRPWQLTPFQKLNFSVEQILRCLVDSNVIGKGCSGVVYRADMENGDVIAVKKLWPTTMAATNHCSDDKCEVHDSFSAEVKTLGSIRHKNIVKFLGCCWNKNTKLLMYDYMPNGSLGSLLHERNGNSLEWELRFQILLGAAQGLAYLHHDCVPPIVHRDIKANNILIGLEFEPYIADFGLAKLVDDGDFARSSNTVAGSYGYIAPGKYAFLKSILFKHFVFIQYAEYGYSMKITEKSDVYSYGVVVLELLTGKQPIDPTIPDGRHVVDWVRQKRGGIEVLDPSLVSRPESEVEEMRQALGIALLCVNSSPDERPSMKDVAAMLKEIKYEREEYAKVDVLLKGSPATDIQENKNSNGVPATTSSMQALRNLYKKSNNTSFSASSLLYSSSSNARMGLKGTVRVVNPLDANLSRGSLSFSDSDARFMPVLDWTNRACGSLCGTNAFCIYDSVCVCNKGYEGNPYLPDGCQDVDECAFPFDNSCSAGTCENTPGSYNCLCPSGHRFIREKGCYEVNVDEGSSIKARIAIIGIGLGLALLVLLTGTCHLCKVVKRRKKRKLKEKFFKQNGGLLVRRRLSSGEDGNIDRIKLFTSKELEQATNHYNKKRILGQGGNGTVYKGMLTDGRNVAIKKPKLETEGKVDEHFINEVVILSQINHRNVVKLHGCCLETKVPLLVYEYIPNGTLFKYIHDRNEKFPLSWDVRLRIATEVAGALAYLHSGAPLPIYHRDIKSTNILLDDKDFGTSRSVAVDQTHLTTRIQGTFGYLDPEYFRSSQFTEKSDVYSFGVVLIELLTGEKPILSTQFEEWRGLAAHFVLEMEENRLSNILDARVVEGGEEDEIMLVASLAKRCIDNNGRQRPTMREVVTELERVRQLHEVPAVKQRNEENVDYSLAVQFGPFDTSATSTGSATANSRGARQESFTGQHFTLNVSSEPLQLLSFT
ncbi:hypothetical protein RJ639_017416, partial [Escallonia herrerae]